MCYRTHINSDKIKLQKRFKANFDPPEIEFPSGEINGFTHPVLPIITIENPDIITGMEWGLLPFWATNKSFQKNTLNCKIETAEEKPSFKNSINNRCLVIVDGFFEWKHVTINGKLVKEKFLLTVPGGDLFTFAGLYSHWNGINTFTILTTEANELMASIHNTKKRMPVILRKDEEALWLSQEAFAPFHNRTEIQLVATSAM